ncbi:hypothetical protein [Jiangella muralis]|uniref:hypothetical protein n=1 Tax=Jiangella muralis TaxID=702383 RepID=UPI00069FDFAE|nr:hypothetical protein [Jiangella muralis]
MTSSNAADLAEVLRLTAQQHATKARIDRLRARIDERARAEWQATGAAPSYKIRGLGTIRLDGADLDPKAVVSDRAEFASFVAEQWPTEVVATITVPADQLPAALEALDFAGVPVEESDATVREAFQGKYLGELVVEKDPAAPEGETRYYAADRKLGVIVPGLGGKPSNPHLTVAVDKDAKADAIEAALAEPVDEPRDDTTTTDAPNVVDPAFFNTDGSWKSIEHAVAHATNVQGGATTPEVEARRMLREPLNKATAEAWLDEHDPWWRNDPAGDEQRLGLGDPDEAQR